MAGWLAGTAAARWRCRCSRCSCWVCKLLADPHPRPASYMTSAVYGVDPDITASGESGATVKLFAICYVLVITGVNVLPVRLLARVGRFSSGLYGVQWNSTDPIGGHRPGGRSTSWPGGSGSSPRPSPALSSHLRCWRLPVRPRHGLQLQSLLLIPTAAVRLVVAPHPSAPCHRVLALLAGAPVLSSLPLQMP